MAGNQVDAQGDRQAQPADRAESRSGGLLARLSHELRTPVTTIYGGSKLLRRSRPGVPAEARREIVEAVEIEAERLYRTIEDLLAIAGPDAGQAIPRQPVLLQRVVPAVVEREQERRPEVRIDAELPPGVPPVSGDEAVLSQIVRNLISNAVRVSPADRAVDVVLDAGRHSVSLSVLDRGPGLDPSELELVFEPFYRSPRTAATPGGAGLGLPACRRLAGRLRGSVSAANRPDGGAEFVLDLPIYREE